MDLQTRINQADQDVRVARQAMFSAQEKWEAASQDEKPQFLAFYEHAVDDLKVQRQNLHNLYEKLSGPSGVAPVRRSDSTTSISKPSPSELANVDAVLKSFPGLRGRDVDASTMRLMVHHRLFTKQSLTDFDGKLPERLLKAGFPLGFVQALLVKEADKVEEEDYQGNALSFDSVLPFSPDQLQPLMTRFLKFMFGRGASPSNSAAQEDAGAREAPGSAQPDLPQPDPSQPDLSQPGPSMSAAAAITDPSSSHTSETAADSSETDSSETDSSRPGSSQFGASLSEESGASLSEESEVQVSEPVRPRAPPSSTMPTSTSSPPALTTATLRHRLGF